MRVIFVVPESSAYIKAGGLGDVAHSLAKAIKSLGHSVTVIMPRYKNIKADLKPSFTHALPFDNSINFSVFEAKKDDINYFFVSCQDFFERDHIYASPKGPYPDNALRFGLFSLISLEIMKKLSLECDIFHIHDWPTALVPLYRDLYYPEFSHVASVLTIHNAMHQGIFEAEYLPRLHIPWDLFRPFGGVEFYGKINFLKAGITFCEVLTTVSPSYAREISNYANGLEGLIREKKYFFGILNGIDTDIWNPESDRMIVANYSIKNFQRGKTKNKQHLKEIFGLKTPIQKPLIGMVSRLTSQKGLDMVEKILDEAIQEGFDFIFLGSGEEFYQEMLMGFLKSYPESVRARIEYNEELAHKIYAGSDIFLMPSIFEPCGISQMIAMRYGTVPVVSRVGGLLDTVIDYISSPEEGTGFSFDVKNRDSFMMALLRARVFYDMECCRFSKDWQEIVKRCMKRDFSWQKSAQEYERIYSIAMTLRKYGSWS
ncbi:MAG: glycogen synthase [Aquificaceae bacterium]